MFTVLMLPDTSISTGFGLFNSGGLEAWSPVPKLLESVHCGFLGSLSDISRFGLIPSGPGTPAKSPLVLILRFPEADGNKITEVSKTKLPASEMILSVGGNKMGSETIFPETVVCGASSQVISTELPA